MEINELDEKLIPDYLIDERNFLEDEISRTKYELKNINEKIESILNLKTIKWEDIKTTKTESYINLARLIADYMVNYHNAIFYLYTDNDIGLTRIDAIKCSELPDYKDNFELYELICNRIKNIMSTTNSNLYYIKGSGAINDFNLSKSTVTQIENLPKD